MPYCKAVQLFEHGQVEAESQLQASYEKLDMKNWLINFLQPIAI